MEPMRQMLFVNPVFHPGANVTVRWGSKWADVKPGELVGIFETLGGLHGLARCVVAIPFTVGTIPAALLALEHDPSCLTTDGILAELVRVYGDQHAVTLDSAVTVVVFEMLPRYPEREAVYAVIDGERDYQDALGSDRTDAKPRSVGDYITMLQHYQAQLVQRWTMNPGDGEALDTMRKVAAIAVHCMEDHGAPKR